VEDGNRWDWQLAIAANRDEVDERTFSEEEYEAAVASVGRRMDGSLINPSPWVICACCEGNGTQCRLGVLSEETRYDWDDEDWANYRNGRYDRACEACKGSGKVREDEQGYQHLDGDGLSTEYRSRRSWMDDAESRMERMMGA
jgi:hypothetical protein